MIKTFADRKLEKFYRSTGASSAKGYPPDLWQKIIDKLFVLDHSHTVDDLRIPPSNRLEKLRGDYAGFYSIRVNDQLRIVFRFENGAAFDVAFVDYH